MQTPRAALALSLSALLLAAATRSPKLPDAVSQATKARAATSTPRVNPAVSKLLRSLSLHDRIAQLIVMPCYGEAINARSPQYEQYRHYVHDLHVGGLIVLGH